MKYVVFLGVQNCRHVIFALIIKLSLTNALINEIK